LLYRDSLAIHLCEGLSAGIPKIEEVESSSQYQNDDCPNDDDLSFHSSSLNTFDP
jgi:hypothetical protein